MRVIRQVLWKMGTILMPSTTRWLYKHRQQYEKIRQARLFREAHDGLAIDRLIRLDELQLGGAYFCSQKRTEIQSLLELLKEHQPQRVCEIGTYRGGTLFLFCQVASPTARILSVDISYTRISERALKNLAKPSQDLRCLEASSYANETMQHVTRWLAGEKIDFLFIDGDHSYEGVRADFEKYTPLVRENGIVALHDIIPAHEEGPTYTGGVPTFWQELKERYSGQEFVEDPHQDGYGIGVIKW